MPLRLDFKATAFDFTNEATHCSLPIFTTYSLESHTSLRQPAQTQFQVHSFICIDEAAPLHCSLLIFGCEVCPTFHCCRAELPPLLPSPLCSTFVLGLLLQTPDLSAWCCLCIDMSMHSQSTMRMTSHTFIHMSIGSVSTCRYPGRCDGSTHEEGGATAAKEAHQGC